MSMKKTRTEGMANLYVRLGAGVAVEAGKCLSYLHVDEEDQDRGDGQHADDGPVVHVRHREP